MSCRFALLCSALFRTAALGLLRPRRQPLFSYTPMKPPWRVTCLTPTRVFSSPSRERRQQRAKQPGFIEPSFPTIAGEGPNGARRASLSLPAAAAAEARNETLGNSTF